MRNRISTSAMLSGAVGSSRISTLQSLETLLAISTICMCPGVRSRTSVVGLMSTPKSSKIFCAIVFIFFWLTKRPIFSP